ncbi:hypothetical protein LCL98_22425 [Rossellomorea aquimaris]|nr:hypothetical protein [Rossellomorea aquimaris]
MNPIKQLELEEKEAAITHKLFHEDLTEEEQKYYRKELNKVRTNIFKGHNKHSFVDDFFTLYFVAALIYISFF